MFSGIVEELGEVRRVDDHRIEISCRTVPSDTPLGGSIAVNGVCLTVVERRDDVLAFDLSEETLERTVLGTFRVGTPVNLERPVTLAARLGGHLVQGHVDGVGVVDRIDDHPDGGATLRIRVPGELRRYVVSKGSIAVDGVSLTVAAVHDDGVSIALIPHTRSVTTLGSRAPGDPVHLEVDLIAKYVERLTESRGGEVR